jgi:DNA-directed RNA polymerase subunit F
LSHRGAPSITINEGVIQRTAREGGGFEWAVTLTVSGGHRTKLFEAKGQERLGPDAMKAADEAATKAKGHVQEAVEILSAEKAESWEYVARRMLSDVQRGKPIDWEHLKQMETQVSALPIPQHVKPIMDLVRKIQETHEAVGIDHVQSLIRDMEHAIRTRNQSNDTYRKLDELAKLDPAQAKKFSEQLLALSMDTGW